MLIAFSVIGFSASTAYCQQDTAQPQKPSTNNESFKKLRAQCETEVSCGKASGDICADAAALLLGDDPPDEFREKSEAQRAKIALRLLERGVDSSNIARGRAYDWYNKSEILNLASYADPYRATELMEMMIKSFYPGGILRKTRSAVGFFAFGVTEQEKREGCAVAKKLLDEGKLDADSTNIAKEIVETGVCLNFAQNK